MFTPKVLEGYSFKFDQNDSNCLKWITISNWYDTNWLKVVINDQKWLRIIPPGSKGLLL